MALLPLGIAINIDGASLFQNRKADPAFLRLQNKIWARDDFACRFCGFRAEEYQEVVNINGNYRQNDPKNLATACVFCAHTKLLGLKNGSKVIYLPDISQIDLNHFVRVLFCSSHLNDDHEEISKGVYQAFKMRASTVENVFGSDCSDTVLFAQTFVDAAELNNKAAYAKLFTQLRWLPNRSDYEDVISYWTKAVLTRKVIEQGIATNGNN
jgi:intracellular multiplication protein IcmJ